MRIFGSIIVLIALAGCASVPPPKSEGLWMGWQDSLYAKDPQNLQLAVAEFRISEATRNGTLTDQPFCISTSHLLSEETISDTEFAAMKRRYPNLAPIQQCVQFQISNSIYVVRANTTVIVVKEPNCFKGTTCFVDAKIRFRGQRHAWNAYMAGFDDRWIIEHDVPVPISTGG